jgi:hypothetical protein
MAPRSFASSSAVAAGLVFGLLGACTDDDGVSLDTLSDGGTDALESATSATSDGAMSDGAALADAQSGSALGLAAKYPCDQGMAGDPAVVFVEDFEEGSVSAITARYESFNHAAGMALVADVPTKSCGKSALRLTSGPDANATDLYKRLENADEWYVRWYVKYQRGIGWHHSGVWFGGYAPALSYPHPRPGTKPNGDDRFSLAIEPVHGVGTNAPRFDTYNYWMQMHSWMAQPSGNTAYYGNPVINRASFTVDEEQWVCLEAHSKVNPDPGSSAGAVLEVWKNDVLVQSFTDSAPLGYWGRDKFCSTAATGPECTDFPPAPGTPQVPLDMRVRTTTALGLNYFWPQNYLSTGPDGWLAYDDMVIAKTRVGCLR